MPLGWTRSPDSALLRTTASGIRSEKVAPCPSPGLVACTDPPCCSTRCLTIERPRPRPFAVRVAEELGLPEAVEHVWQELGLDPDAGVGNGDLDVRAHPLQQDLNASP